MKRLWLVALILSSAISLSAEQECKRRPDLVGPCSVVHGRAELGNGTPSLRIWRVGTKHKYGVIAGDRIVAPQNLLNDLHMFENSVYGDYEVCPLTREIPGSMTMVCIQSARNLVVTEYGSTKIVRK